MKEQARSRWMKLLAQFNRHSVFLPGTWNMVLEPRYTEPHRAYHTFEHILSCLDLYEKYVPANVLYRESIELAIWFHDLVYSTSSSDNEEQSANIMETEALKCGFDPQLIKVAKEMILATKQHEPDTRIAMGYFLDIDMSILGSDPDTYDRYEKNIRKEYDWVSEDMFKNGRMMLLKSFLAMDWIYNTKKFRQLYEGQARENIKRAMAALI